MEIAIPSIIKTYSQMELPDKDDVEYYLSRQNRVFYIEGVIYRDLDNEYSPTAQLAKTIININLEDIDKKKEDRKPIIVLIDSLGGEIDQAMLTIDVIKASITPVYTVALSSVMSAAFLIFLSGHKRFVFAHSQLLTHQGRVDNLGGTPDELAASMKNYRDTLARMKEFILENSKIDAKTFTKYQKKDWYISPKEAVEVYGVADKIITDLSDIFK